MAGRETSVKIAAERTVSMATGEDNIEIHLPKPEPDFDGEDRREDSDIPSPTSTFPGEDDADVASQPDSESQLLQLEQEQQHYIPSMDSTIVIRQLPSEGIAFQLWPAATALVSLLDRYRSCPSTSPLSTTFPNSFEGCRRPLRILELGSGTGLVGIAAAAVLGANVTVTDLPHVLPNLQFNADANQKLLEVNGGTVEVAPLAWGNEEHMEAIAGRERESDAAVNVIMGSDVVYHDHLYDPLLRTLKFFLLGVGGCDVKNKWRRVFVMGHLKRWKKESAFFKKARKLFDVEIIHADPAIHGSRVGVVVYRFAPKLSNSE